ncbi:helix-turn-helix domain-containing protein [Caballeronia glebae]|uniref:helix-turn-helix domain-containing protein n=1 Tax=Caballeronia glebae TaxID=1777143 RepID=UPI0038B939E2
MPPFPQRLKEARQRAGLSQEKLGMEAGLDPMSASARMNRYELGKRVPSLGLVERIAAVLNVPMAYFYAVADDEADMLRRFHLLSKRDRARALAFVDGLAG